MQRAELTHASTIMVDAAAETDARAAFLYTPMDDLMRDAFGPPASNLC